MQVGSFLQQQSIADHFSTKDQKPHLKKKRTNILFKKYSLEIISNHVKQNFILRFQYCPSNTSGAKRTKIIIKPLQFEA